MDAENDRVGELLIDDQSTIDRVLNHSEYFLVLKPLSELKDDADFRQLIDEQLICAAWRFEEEEMVDLLRIVTTEGDRTLIMVSGEIAPECPVFLYQWLLENHYDVFGMIETRDAFDVNNLD